MAVKVDTSSVRLPAASGPTSVHPILLCLLKCENTAHSYCSHLSTPRLHIQCVPSRFTHIIWQRIKSGLLGRAKCLVVRSLSSSDDNLPVVTQNKSEVNVSVEDYDTNSLLASTSAFTWPSNNCVVVAVDQCNQSFWEVGDMGRQTRPL